PEPIVTVPSSNMRYVQAYRGEAAECITHGLRTIFEHIGGAARHWVFDNATGAGRRTGARIIESKLFSAFKLHYRCQARYCNPYSGHEKCNVENAVLSVSWDADYFVRFVIRFAVVVVCVRVGLTFVVCVVSVTRNCWVHGTLAEILV